MLADTPRLLARTWLSLAHVRYLLGQRDAAREAADAALDIIEPEGGWELLLALRLRARVCDSDAARERLRERLAELLARVSDDAAREALRAVFEG